jgi:hypothetical protein
MENKLEIPLGWKLTYAEVSNNVYEMRLTWELGPMVETKGDDFDGMLSWCIESAKDIEDQLRQKGLIL